MVTPAVEAPRSRPRTGSIWDGCTALTAYVVLLFAIPSRLTFSPLGGAGSPAAMVGLACLVLWVWYRLSVSTTSAWVAQPVRRAALLFLAALGASVVAALVRPTNADELRSTQLSLLLALGWLGIMLMACDGITSTRRLTVLMHRLAVVAGLFAGLGAVQFFTGQQLTNYIVIPGLRANQALAELASRDGFNRPASTAIHPIEFGMAITALLPICLHVALHAKELGLFRRWAPVAAIAVAVPVSISRSAIVGAVVALVLLVVTWPPRLRAWAIAATGALAVAVFILLPGVIGTLTGLFSGAANDPSALSRTDSYGLAGQFISQAPWFGRGIGTFLPSYRILDNQYLQLTIDAGLVGVGALFGLFVTAMVCTSLVRRRLTDPAQRDLAQALVASVGSAAVGYALFDAFSFPIFAGLTFLLVGLCGALWRLNAGPRQEWLRA